VWSPAGSQLAYTGHPNADPWGPTTLDNLFVRDLASGEDRGLLSGMDREPGNSAMADVRYNVPVQRPVWSDSGSLLTLLSDGGNVHIYRCGLDGDAVVQVGGERDIQSFSVAGNGAVAFASSGLSNPTEVWVLDGDGDRQITDFNADYLNGVELA